ncbi:hypothetical protein ACHAO9_006742 [Fusarium lateritium]
MEEYGKLLKSELKFIILKLSDTTSQYEVEHSDTNSDWDIFRDKLEQATSASKSGSVGAGPRFGIYDLNFVHDGQDR